MTVAPRITERELNRATLARQLLLERSDLDAEAAVTHLVGLQAQTTHTWYVGLWTRLRAVDPVAVGDLLVRRRLVRLPAMRSTIHLLTADDALLLRPLTEPAVERVVAGSFGRMWAGLDRAEVAAATRELVTAQPLSAAELGRALAERFPGREPEGLAMAARVWLPMVQVPPRGVWARSGRALQAPLDTWLGRPLREPSPADAEETVRRYLAAFGPATVRDAQVWSGLTRLAEVVDRMRGHLVTFTAEDGRELLDLPDAPRPGADVPAPPRLLYDYDNLLLSHADRSRVVGAGAGAAYAAQGYTTDSNRQPSAILVDGVVAGTWTVERAKGRATVTARPFGRVTGPDRTALAEECARLLDFLHPRDDHDVRIGQGVARERPGRGP